MIYNIVSDMIYDTVYDIIYKIVFEMIYNNHKHLKANPRVNLFSNESDSNGF